ncbi:hypothetical protein ACIQ6K_33255 [Streptomyces sp. NPDC096354]|uniref:hypothetical protein n=1 Tax=Streptomyces sp. NPDC096354 TaxID=3366088 RepID=UPI0038269F0A
MKLPRLMPLPAHASKWSPVEMVPPVFFDCRKYALLAPVSCEEMALAELGMASAATNSRKVLRLPTISLMRPRVRLFGWAGRSDAWFLLVRGTERRAACYDSAR